MLTQPDGKVLQTEGQGHGKVLWKDLTVTATVVTANQKGILSVPPVIQGGTSTIPVVSASANAQGPVGALWL